ncbi:MAG: flagellar basal body rod protein FlgC [Micavibrio aeruginosavorus]|uniref:Flagellar basal-body rod protein FlgC n=1 Tax=Micavibrio aeruginosavorus TaxID=349221 RepID=A0A2W5PUQ1_9BACT|nr:MAG: flagellar basal body rod protein FlgC [Micavibrio aeruginosavorus]
MWNTMAISAYGMKAQGERTRVISENIANANTAAISPDAKPYTRKIITFKNEMDKQYDTNLVKVKDIAPDKKTDYTLKYMPDHPGANAAGYVQMPNVNMVVELTDMREAQRSYEANLGMMDNYRTMSMRTIDMLR